MSRKLFIERRNWEQELGVGTRNFICHGICKGIYGEERGESIQIEEEVRDKKTEF